MTGEVLLAIEGLRTWFSVEEGTLRAVDGLDLEVRRGEVLALVGESGCGKTATALSVLRLVDDPGRIAGGSIRFDGVDLLSLSEEKMQRVRGDRLAMIFQQPHASLNPVQRVGRQLTEVLRVHRDMDRDAARERAVGLLGQVGIPDPEARMRAYPHELSGGMAQRVMIAIALACSPELIIADEPTTALDVTIQAQIMDVLRDLCATGDTAVVLITHDLELVAEIATRVAVMYAGHILEECGIRDLYDRPLHPYTQGLLASMPVLGANRETLAVIPGTVPTPIDLPPGCRFASRCEARVERGLAICERREPDLLPVAPGHAVRCWLYQDGDGRRAPLGAPGRSPSPPGS